MTLTYQLKAKELGILVNELYGRSNRYLLLKGLDEEEPFVGSEAANGINIEVYVGDDGRYMAHLVSKDEREVLLVSDVLNRSLMLDILINFYKSYPKYEDVDKLFNELAPLPVVFDIKAGFEHDPDDDNDEAHLTVHPDEHELVVVYRDGKEVAGIDLYTDRADLGYWNKDGEWWVAHTVDF